MYPLVIAPNGQQIMRINHDASISVKWDEILDERYKLVSDANLVIVKMCEVLLAARDNFVPIPWDDAARRDHQWEHFSVEMDYIRRPIPKNVDRMNMCSMQPIARICHVGHWHIWWSEVEDGARLPVEESIAAMIGICKLMVAAKDRFPTKPWRQLCDD